MQSTQRRSVLVVWAAAFGLVVAACSSATPPAATPAPASTSATSAQATSAPATSAPVAPGSTAAATAAPAPAQTGAQPRRGGTLTIGTTADVVTLDPAVGGGIPADNVMALLFDQLVKITPDQKIVPDLATSWSVDNLNWTFKLRQGVKFHDGTPFNAQAVKAYFDRLLGPEKPNRSSRWVPYLDSVEVVDDNTVRFKTKFPDPFFLNRLADDSGFIPSPAAQAQYGKDVAKHPVGTGPFKFKDWVVDQQVTVVRNDDYWGDKAYLDSVIFRPIPEAGARAIALQSGDVQLAAAIAPEQLPQVQADPNLTTQSRASILYLTVGMNNLKKPFDDVRVRQAMNYAIDQQSIAKNIYEGLAEPVSGAIPPDATGFSQVNGLGYNPEKAKQLLAEAGYPNGFSATLTTPKGRYPKDFEFSQAVQQQLKAVGVDIKLDSVEWARYLELVRMPPDQSPLQMWFDGWQSQVATDVLNQRYGCDSFRPKGVNLHGYCNKDLDQLVNQAQQTLDETKRNALLQQVQQIIAQDSPSIWGVTPKVIAGMSKKLHGVLLYPTEELTVDEKTWLEP